MRGYVISDSQAVDFKAFEARVRALAKRHKRLRGENLGLRETLAKRDHSIRELEEQIRDLNQRRQDTGKRLDELISRIGQLDVQLESGAAAKGGKG